MLNVTSSPSSEQTQKVCHEKVGYEAQLRPKHIKDPKDYGINLPEWLIRAIQNNPPGTGPSCPIEGEALLASSFDLAF